MTTGAIEPHVAAKVKTWIHMNAMTHLWAAGLPDAAEAIVAYASMENAHTPEPTTSSMRRPMNLTRTIARKGPTTWQALMMTVAKKALVTPIRAKK